MTGDFFAALTCLGSLGFFLIVFGFFAFWRYLQYRETVVLAEKGLVRAAPVSGNGSGALRWGIVLAALGLALSIGLYPLGFLIDPAGHLFPLHFGPWMLTGLVPLFFGLGLVLIHVITRESKPKTEMTRAQTSATRAALDSAAPADKDLTHPVS